MSMCGQVCGPRVNETPQWLKDHEPPVCVHAHMNTWTHTQRANEGWRARLAYRTELCLKENGRQSQWRTRNVMSHFNWSLCALVFLSPLSASLRSAVLICPPSVFIYLLPGPKSFYLVIYFTRPSVTYFDDEVIIFLFLFPLPWVHLISVAPLS